ncbi:MAG: PilZ domain-containing protein [bacterium]|nr:PilZ domain-containing protein [bacterium]
MKFFGRNKKNKSAADARKYYRKAPGKTHALTGHVQMPQSGEVVVADVLDVSAGGASLQMETSQVHELSVGVSANLLFRSLRVRSELLVQAHVVSVLASKDGRSRFGFSIMDSDELFTRIEPYYLKYFNRRRLLRVLPELGRSMKADVRTPDGGGFRLDVQDVTEEGIGFALHADEIEWMGSGEAFDVEFKIPGANVVWNGTADRVHITGLKDAVRAGLAFREPDAKTGPAQGALEVWLSTRRVAMAKWDSAYD